MFQFLPRIQSRFDLLSRTKQLSATNEFRLKCDSLASNDDKLDLDPSGSGSGSGSTQYEQEVKLETMSH